MTRNAIWLNNDGLTVGFGTRDSVYPFAGTVKTEGNREQITLVLDYRNMPTTDNVRFYNATNTEPFSKSVRIPLMLLSSRLSSIS